ncbi:HpcH/HpaI aldolase family protein [Ahrensia kielensis]|uniref:HpcH/HpaI aldolase family protein n=1 Tax=Ahrensia kielensis TaxID=76980 RepID=UPI000378B064|nr:aldolase/citrate lyase family protein [Ahrensia kielensis]
MNKTNFNAKLRDGIPMLVVNVDHPSPGLVNYLCAIGCDAVFFDCEQGSPDIESVENMARAARLGNVTSLVRLWSREPWMIERMMLRGVDGIVAPRVDTAETAEQIVDTVRYVFPKNYEQKTVVVQVESLEAIDSLDDMLAVDGIDAFFIGPVDLSKSLGHGGRLDVPEVAELVERTTSRIVSAGKSAGMLVTEKNVRAIQKTGATFLYCHANDFLRIGMAEFKARMAI